MGNPPGDDRERLRQAIEAQERLRGDVDDEIIDAAVEALRGQLNSLAPRERRRRQVTVLFADVSEFTSMSSDLDHEVVADVMNELWSRLDAVIAAHGGRVDKHIGDAVMAIWGATSTSEDDVERAVRAGLAIQAELAAGDRGLRMRVGINTGPVYLGAVGASPEFTAMGDAVNVASRLEGLAALDDVIISHETYRHVRGVFDVQELGPATVKGKSEPIRVYRVERAKERAFRTRSRGVEDVETQTIGRAAELALMQEDFDRVLASPAIRRVTVVGDAGVGKSRLLYEFENWVDLHPESVHLFRGRASSARQLVGFGLMRDVVGQRFGVLDSDMTSVVAEKLRGGLDPVLTADEADLVGHWLGFDLRSSRAVQPLLGSGQLATTARAHLIRYLRTLAAGGPIVLLLEDLHWADDESLALIDEFAKQLSEVQLLVIGVARPTLMERAVAADLLERSSTAIRLLPLGPDMTRNLVGEILQKVDQVPDELTDLICQRADGNPYYVEELVKMLIEQRVIETADPWKSWLIHLDRLDPDQVPPTLTGVLQARLDSLRQTEREIVQRCSVVGRIFWDLAVDALGPEDIGQVRRALAVASEREFVFHREPSAFDGCTEYGFQHALLREVTYETVLLRDRERLHRLVAGWITQSCGERLLEYAVVIATHHRLASDFPAAADLLHQAATAALDSGDSARARRTIGEALQLWRASDLTPPVSALLVLTESCLRLGDLDAADAACTEAIASADFAGHRGNAHYLASWIAAERGEAQEELALLNAALPDASQVGGLLLTRVLGELATSACVSGDKTTAWAFAEQLRAAVPDDAHPAERLTLFAVLTVLSNADGDTESALRYSSAGLRTAEGIGDLEGQILALGNLGVIHHERGDEHGSSADYLAALHYYRRCVELAHQMGLQLSEGMNTANLGQLHVRLGNAADARRLIGRSLGLIRATGGVTNLIFTVLAEADRRLAFGDRGKGLRLIGMVQGHPAKHRAHRVEIERILARFDLPKDFENELARGAKLDFDFTVDSLIAELSDD